MSETDTAIKDAICGQWLRTESAPSQQEERVVQSSAELTSSNQGPTDESPSPHNKLSKTPEFSAAVCIFWQVSAALICSTDPPSPLNGLMYI